MCINFEPNEIHLMTGIDRSTGYEKAIQKVEKRTLTERDKWTVTGPIFDDGTTRWILYERVRMGRDGSYYEMGEVYEKPGDMYLYYVVSYFGDKKPHRVLVTKYEW